jgi:hypothetical protein
MLLAAFGAGANPTGPQITSSTEGAQGTFLIPFDASFAGGTFDGMSVTNTPDTSVIVKYVRNGDVDLDGSVTAADVGAVVSAYALNTTTPGLDDITTSWFLGDVNFEGVVSASDVGSVVSYYALYSNLPALSGSPISSEGGGISSSSSVPEPASLFLLGLGSAGMLLRSKRRSSRFFH